MKKDRRFPTATEAWVAGLLVWFVGAAGNLTWGQTHPIQWRWSYPLPHGLDVYDATFVDGLLIQVGPRGMVYSSADLTLWIFHPTPTTNALRGVTWFGSKIVISGARGTILVAETNRLDQWTRIDLQTEDWLESITASEDCLVTVGDNGSVYTSTNALDWTLHRLKGQPWLRSVTYGENGFVTVGEGGFIAWSTNGVDWVEVSSGTTENLNRVRYFASSYWVVGDNGTLLRSADGQHWSILSPHTTANLYDVAGNETVQLVVGEGALQLRLYSVWADQIHQQPYAPDWNYWVAVWIGPEVLVLGEAGILLYGTQTGPFGTYEWRELGDSLRNWFWDGWYGNGRVLIGGDFAMVLASSIGTEWDVGVPPDSAANQVILGLAAHDQHYVAVGTGGLALWSTNQLQWNAATQNVTDQDLQGVAWFQDRFYAAGGEGIILQSPDGTQWEFAAQIPSSPTLSGAAANEQTLVVCGDQGSLYWSEDGVQWTLVSTQTTNWIYRVRWLSDRFVAVGENGTMWTSVDGRKWEQLSVPTQDWIVDVCVFQGQFYAVTIYGELLTSEDGEHWERMLLPYPGPFLGIVAGPDQLYLFGANAIILRGHPGRLRIFSWAWNADHPELDRYFLLSGLPGDSVSIDVSPDLESWSSLLTGTIINNNGFLLLAPDASVQAPAPCAFFRACLVEE